MMERKCGRDLCYYDAMRMQVAKDQPRGADLACRFNKYHFRIVFRARGQLQPDTTALEACRKLAGQFVTFAHGSNLLSRSNALASTHSHRFTQADCKLQRRDQTRNDICLLLSCALILSFLRGAICINDNQQA
jgi:hypothetical protein